jgi:hypothetical protein
MELEEPHPPALAEIVRSHLARLIEDTGLGQLIPAHELTAALEDIGLGLGQLLADVERSMRRNVGLDLAVHDHEGFPYLSRFHGWMQDAFVMELPNELLPIMRRLLRTPPSDWMIDTHDSLSIVARSSTAGASERALATLMLFEGIRANLSVSAYRMNGGWEGVGGCDRDLDALAWNRTANVLKMPLQADEDDVTFAVIVVDAMRRLHELTMAMWDAQKLVAELARECEERARVEMVLRTVDPIDASILRNALDRAQHQQAIPDSRLPQEHPLLLRGLKENAIYKRRERAINKLRARRKQRRPVTLAALILETEEAHA